MRTWECFQHNRKPGRTREKLCALLAAALPEWDIYPEDLIVQNPQYSSVLSDCCSWTACAVKKTDREWTLQLHSWVTMTSLVKSGIELEWENGFSAEVHPLRAP